MGALSKIGWTDHTFSPVRGCRHAILPDGTTSPACAGPDGKVVCYAETMSHRNPATLGVWGADGARSFGVESYWRQPGKWNADAEAAGVRARVFCASLADIFEGADVDGTESRDAIRPDYLPMLTRLWALIRATPCLDWQLLTKRPWNMERWVRENGCPGNTWAGTTAENQAGANDRVPWLIKIPALVRFVSVEPMSGPVSLAPRWMGWEPRPRENPEVSRMLNLQWVIVGGASGSGADRLNIGYARTLVAECVDAEVPVFVKQLGSAWAHTAGCPTRAGTDPSRWPTGLAIQQFPTPAPTGAKD